MKVSQPSWQAILKKAKHTGQSQELIAYLQSHALELSENRQLVSEALALAEQNNDYSLLKEVLDLSAEAVLRSDALAAVLGMVDAIHPQFVDLMSVLREGERAFVLGVLLEAIRLDPVPESRLLRLKKLLLVVPKHSRSLYWAEAEALAAQGGDDAQLMLLDLVRQLPEQVQHRTVTAVKESLAKVKNTFKKAMAFVALSELATLSPEDIQEAKQVASRIPDESLRIMTLTRLSEL